MHARTTRARGFTLVEVMVALVIMAVIATMSWQGVDAMLRTRESTQTSVERTLRLSNVLGQWEQDLTAIYPSRLVPGLQFDGGALRLVRRADDGVQVVVWALREGVLQRWTSPPTTLGSQLQEHWIQSQQLLGNETRQMRMLDGVVSMQVYCHRNNAWSNCQSTGDVTTTPIGGPNPPGGPVIEQLPGGVRVVFGLAVAQDQISLTRDVRLSPQPPP